MNSNEQQVKDFLYIVFLFFSLILFGVIIVTKYDSDEEVDSIEEEEEKYTFYDYNIYFTSGLKMYDISFFNDYIDVVVYNKEECDGKECSSQNVDEYMQDYNVEYYDFLEKFITEIDEEYYLDDYSIIVDEYDLNKNDRKYFYEIIGSDHLENIKYDMVGSASETIHKDRGYFIKETGDGHYMVFIIAGEDSNKSVKIDNIKVFGNSVTIYVKEDGKNNPMAFVRFNKEPIIDSVYSISENEEFVRLK